MISKVLTDKREQHWLLGMLIGKGFGLIYLASKCCVLKFEVEFLPLLELKNDKDMIKI